MQDENESDDRTTSTEDEDKRPALEFDHNIIEHLGIKLYQNRPVNVLAEIVSNSWDAGAQNVWIDLSDDGDAIAISDDGSGMSFSEIEGKYLVIGLQKRNDPQELAERQRKPMGRKGIGKLAPFGIARIVDVITCQSGVVNWFRLNLSDIIAAQAKKRYVPEFPLKNANWNELQSDNPSLSGYISAFRDRVARTKTGTLILLRSITQNRLPEKDYIIDRMAARFTVILARQDFTVWVNDTEIDHETAMPDFELRIPLEGVETVEVGGREVRTWAGFFRKAETTTDEAGVGVYAHGKIAQDRPFFFYSTGKEVFQRYLYAVVEADWIDELDEDVISTDRTSIDWQNEQLEDLADWGKKKVSSWLTQYDTYRKSRHDRETADAATELRRARRILNFSQAENTEIDNLVARATETLPKSQIESAREGLLEAVTKAWANEPTRHLIKQLWDNLNSSDLPSDAFTSILQSLDTNSVPESMGLAFTFAQRAYALTILTKLIHERSETNLQDLIEEFPWVIDPSGVMVTADRQLRTTINELADRFTGADRYDPLSQIKDIPDSARADFVFLADPGKTTIRVVELKAPGGDVLQRRHETQLVSYLNYIEQHYTSASLQGILVGNKGPGGTFAATDGRVEVKGWDDVLYECRAIYVELLAAMLIRADVTSEDGRAALLKEFAGSEVWELLKKVAEKDSELATIMTRLQHLAE